METPHHVWLGGMCIAMLHTVPPGSVFMLYDGEEHHVQGELSYHHDRPVIVTRWADGTIPTPDTPRPVRLNPCPTS